MKTPGAGMKTALLPSADWPTSDKRLVAGGCGAAIDFRPPRTDMT
jgi:hypothetical protein